MLNYTIEDKLPSVEEYKLLWTSAGWLNLNDKDREELE
jgi:hypothetical protein